MGNIEAHDAIDTPADSRNRKLDISRHVNYRQYKKHMNNDISWETIHTEIPSELCDSINLFEHIDASFNAIGEIPPELPLRLPHLTHINLSYNRIATLPVNFALFFHLDTLILKHNLLKDLPESFCHLVNLSKLDLSHNSLRELPANLGNLPSLCNLNVSHNKLKKLPLSLGGCSTLRVILAKGNRLIQPPQSTCNEGSIETIDYLRKNYKQKSPERVISVAMSDNVFPRVRGSQFAESVANTHSAHTLYTESQTEMFQRSRIKAPLLPTSQATVLDVDELSDRIVGLIYGAIVGDAVGIGTSYLDPDECLFNYGQEEILHYSSIIRDEHRVHWRRGDWTIHGDLLLLVMECILQWGGVVDELDFANRMIEWKRTGFVEFGDHSGFDAGTLINEVLADRDFITNPHDVAQETWERFCCDKSKMPLVDNTALTRSLVLGVAHFEDLKEISSNALRICKTTHSCDLGVTGSIFVTVMVALMLQGKHLSEDNPKEALIEEAATIALQYLPEETEKQKFRNALKIEKYSSLDFCDLGKEQCMLKTISGALISFRNCTGDIRKTLMSLIMLGGDSTGRGSLAAGLIGCYYGYKRIPVEWTEELRTKQKFFLDHRINQLLDMMGIP